MNNAVLIGRLTKDPVLRYLPSGNNTAIATFTLAIDRDLGREKKQENESRNIPTADFVNIKVWGKQAENCSNYLSKGRLVAVHGRIETGSYEHKDGYRVYTTEVVANKVQFLEWGDTNNQDQQNNFELGGLYEVDNEDIPF